MLVYHVLNREAGRATLLEKDADYERIASRSAFESSPGHREHPRKPK